VIERVIENWLTSVAEREFQLAFCQVLALQGYQIVHVSTHGPDEQGKDIIAIDPAGTPCAYQLKVGDIGLPRWRAEVWPEVEELLDIPINHPSVDKTRRHRSFLVTTGNLSDPVKRVLDDRNQKRKRQCLGVVETSTRGQLLTAFVQAHGSFLPNDPSDMRLFLELYGRRGDYNLPKDKLSQFLVATLGLDPNQRPARPSPKDLQRMMASAMLLAGYVLLPYERAKNHWAAAEGWVVTACHLLALAERWGAPPGLETTIRLLREALGLQLEALEEEVWSRRGLFQGSLFDGVVFPYRLLVLYGYLCGHRLWRKLRGLDTWDDPRVREFCLRAGSRLRPLPGESAVPYLVNAFWYLKLSGEEALAARLYELLLSTASRGAAQPGGIPNTYYDLGVLLEQETGLAEEPITESFEGRSYALKALVMLGARHGYRDVLAAHWRPISHAHWSEFFAEPAWQFWLWRARDGRDVGAFPEPTQGWAALRAEAASLPRSPTLPAMLTGHPDLAVLLPLVYPHRFRSDLVAHLDQLLWAPSVTEEPRAAPVADEAQAATGPGPGAAPGATLPATQAPNRRKRTAKGK
jgi:hypothetical protein